MAASRASAAVMRQGTGGCWLAVVLAALVGCAAPGASDGRGADERGAGEQHAAAGVDAGAAGPAEAQSLIIVAVDDAAPEVLPGAGATPRSGYGRSAGYAGSTRSAADAAAVAAAHGLDQRAAWSIAPLGLRCMLYRIAPGADRSDVLARVARDPRVRLAQPLNHFETLAAADATRLSADARLYNDPYVGLQRGFAAIDAAEAQRWSRGDGVRVALIDTGVDATHPDLAGRIAGQRDFVPASRPAPPGGERHGTQTAGVIAAGANNRIGIVGIAPQARLLAYRACWPVAGAAASRCDSFTLAQALGAAIAAGADVINLSLGGPADALLQRLVEHAIRRGAVVVGAVPPGGRLDGFPVGVPGVLAVASSDDDGSVGRNVLAAPGRDILTLAPGGSYDYVSGSSLAAAHVSGAVALLRALDPGLRADTAQIWLERRPRLAASGAAGAGDDGAAAGAPVDVCAAMRRLRAAAACTSAGAGGPTTAP